MLNAAYNALLPAPTPIDAEDAVRFTRAQRAKLWLITALGYLAVRSLGPTLRYTVSAEADELLAEPVHPGIYAFWHRCVIPAAWRWRNQNIAVVTSRSFDGEYIARIIAKFGYGAVRGSSSRGGTRALLECRRLVEQGQSVAFTIDGPRGPVYVAKPGAVALARVSGVRVVPFYIALEHAWVLRSWDRMMIPKPFSRAVVRIGRAVLVPRDADDETFARCQAELQIALERIRDWAEENAKHPPPRH